jgi:hypothetical protein
MAAKKTARSRGELLIHGPAQAPSWPGMSGRHSRGRAVRRVRGRARGQVLDISASDTAN